MAIDELILSEFSGQAMLGRVVLTRLALDEPFDSLLKADLIDLAESLDLMAGARIEALLREAGDV